MRQELGDIHGAQLLAMRADFLASQDGKPGEVSQVADIAALNARCLVFLPIVRHMREDVIEERRQLAPLECEQLLRATTIGYARAAGDSAHNAVRAGRNIAAEKTAG